MVICNLLDFFRIQEEREERHRLKREMGISPDDNSNRKSRFEPVDTPAVGVSLGLKPPGNVLVKNKTGVQKSNN